MSICLKEKVTCPKCGFIYEHECCPSVNASTDPLLREKVISGNICVSYCPSCKVTTRLVYPCLYQDPKNNFAVYFLPRTEMRSIPSDGDISNILEVSSAKDRRLVDDYTDLIEKISIFENGLDDRAMELFKAYTALSIMSKPDATFKPDTLVFQGMGDEEHFLMLGVRDKEMHQISVPKKLYTALDEAIKGRDWGEGSDFFMVDMLWALDLLKKEGSILDKTGTRPTGEPQ